jgi:1,4-alpha-glucan branching enzyme
MTPTENSTPRKVKFQIAADPGCEVYVAGTFNNWDPRKDRLAFKDGTYSASLFLPKGRYEYKFVINDIWCIDPECPEWTSNDFGTLNSVVTVE